MLARGSAGILLIALFACRPQASAADGGPSASRDAAVPNDAGTHPLDASHGVVPDAGPLPVVDPACSTNGCLRSLAGFGDYTAAEIQSYVDPAVVVENGYSVFQVWFSTSGLQARATVTLPFDVAPPARGWDVGINNPGTVGLNPSCALGNSVALTGLAGWLGARGMVGVALDYPGLASGGPHPYLVAEVEAHASLDAVRAALALARLEAVPVSGRVVMVGLSQGGHATLSAARLWPEYAPEIDIRGFAVAGPANVFLEQWAAGVGLTGPHLVYHALLTYAWARHYGHDGGILWAPEAAPIMDDVMLTRCAFSPDGGTVGDALGEDPARIFSAPFLAAFEAGTFAGFPVFAAGFAENRVKPFPQRVPLRIYQGDADDTVLRSGTDALVAELRDGGVEVDYVVVQGGHHTDVAFFYLALPQLRDGDAMAWLRGVLDR